MGAQSACYVCSMADRIGVRELRQHASVYLHRVQAGETLIVTDRGRPVAVVTPTADALRDSVVDLVQGLVAAGAYPDLDAALAAGVDELVRRLRSAVVDRAVVEGYSRVPQEADPWAEEAAAATLASLERW